MFRESKGFDDASGETLAGEAWCYHLFSFDQGSWGLSKRRTRVNELVSTNVR